MTPLLIFLLALAGVYLGAVEASFSALMRLSLRLDAERKGRPDALAAYLDDPMLLFVPVRLLLALATVSATVLVAGAYGVSGAPRLLAVILTIAGFVIVFEILLPLILVHRNPERALELLLPSFSPIAKLLSRFTRWVSRSSTGRRAPAAPLDETPASAAAESQPFSGKTEDPERQRGEEQRLLRSLVDFGGALVREVMTPRLDIVAIRDGATIGDVRALFREQEYSRFPVYAGSLDNIVGFIFVKDLVALDASDDSRPITPLLRPAVVVPESKLVPELLQQFQRQQTQCAIVVDEYGGTAGLVTIEDLLEEIVGEIRDEYDVESEPVVDEGGGRYVFDAKVGIDEVSQRLSVHIERGGFETVGGYLLTHLGRVPSVGERFDVDGLDVEVLEVDRRRIHKVRLVRHGVTPAPVGEHAG